MYGIIKVAKALKFQGDRDMEDYKKDTINAEDYRRDVPYSVYRDMAIRYENTVKRFIVAILIAIAMIVGSNVAWLIVWNSYDFSSESYTIENHDDGNANYLESGMEGVINNGLKDSGETENGN
jgi:hypothetical protein